MDFLIILKRNKFTISGNYEYDATNSVKSSLKSYFSVTLY